MHYRDIPHLSTGVTPVHSLFREGCRSNLQHKSISEEVFASAWSPDNYIKTRQR